MFHAPSMGELIVIAAIGLLLFGKRLPEVGRSLGKGIVEFKKGLKGIDEDVEAAANKQQSNYEVKTLPPQEEKQPAQPSYKFDPYTGKPIEQPTEEHAAAETH
jgi:sec-independent protein translocase protein TatA